MPIVFGEFSFDAERRELSSAGHPIHLSPKAFQLLGLLIERRPRAVSKEDLYAFLWPDTFVEEANLKNLMAEVRAALRDDARAPRFVKTLYRFGYAFTAGATERSAAGVTAYFLRHLSSHFPLLEGENVIGRDPTCAVMIDEPGVSRYHARITISGPSATIEDIGSKNGTFVEGQRVTTARILPPGTQIRLGDTPLSFHHREALESTRSAR